jgi:hypothetical protein
MSRRHLLCVLILISFGATVLCAADFWVKKKYSEWTPTEVQKMLNDSPWAKAVEIVVGNPRSLKGAGGGAGATSPGRGGGGGGGMMSDANLPRETFVIRFNTALPMKQALARNRFQDDVLKSPEAAQFLSRQEPNYVISVVGSPRRLPTEPTGLKELARLILKGREIQPANVDIDRGQGGAAVLYTFPKGDKPVTLEDDNAEFEAKFPSGLKISRRFKLKDLVFDGKLEM